MRKVIGVWDEFKDTANQALKDRGYGENTFSCKVRETATGQIGWAASWIMNDSELSRVSEILNGVIPRHRTGSYPLHATFDQAIAAEGFERVLEDRQ